MKQHPKVNEVNEFLEIASDFEDPLELIRESLSNSFDANAEHVYISIRTSPDGSDIIIEDDGGGMDRRDLESFFDLGNSRKTDSIGYKGHGTKIFYKSDKISVNTSKDGQTLHAAMEQPWQKLNDRILPEYEVTKREGRSGRSGTLVKVSGFKSGEGFKPEQLTYNKIHHYLKWKTIAGSTAHFFDDDFHEMAITVELDDAIDDSMDVLETTNKFEFPDEQLVPGSGDFPAKSMCKVYPPREITLTHADGTSTVQIVGMAGGKDARNQLPTYGRHSVQFGVWLAKDHIKIERLNEAIAHDNEFIHFLFVANCQDIELSSNRGKIRNKSSPVYQALEDELKHYLSKVTHDDWFKRYLEARRQGEIARKAQSQSKSVEQRRSTISSREQLEPDNVTELLLLLERSNTDAGVSDVYHIEDYHPGQPVASIIREEATNTLYNASVHLSATDHFENEVPLQSTELLICWEYGDKDFLREISRNGYLNGSLTIDFDADEITYERDGTVTTIDVLCLCDRLDRAEQLHLPLSDPALND